MASDLRETQLSEKTSNVINRAELKLDTLEARILMSATWVDGEGDTDTSDGFDPLALDTAVDLVDVAPTPETQTGLFDETGTDGADRLNYSSSPEGVFVDAGGGNDLVLGSAGDDTIFGNTGNDDLRGYDGDDTFIYQEGDGLDRFRGGEGFDTIDATGAQTLELQTLAAGDSIEQIIGSDAGLAIQGTDGIDRLDFRNTELTNVTTIDVGEGDDRVLGSNGNDTIIGGTGNDDLRGYDGD
ncbi:MAG: hypothetical protein KDA92_02640, partial [Planctomycetales bacterium]|nr:hypothetical protein [Planctomycetales bacterium]